MSYMKRHLETSAGVALLAREFAESYGHHRADAAQAVAADFHQIATLLEAHGVESAEDCNQCQDMVDQAARCGSTIQDGVDRILAQLTVEQSERAQGDKRIAQLVKKCQLHATQADAHNEARKEANAGWNAAKAEAARLRTDLAEVQARLGDVLAGESDAALRALAARMTAAEVALAEWEVRRASAARSVSVARAMSPQDVFREFAQRITAPEQK